MLYLIEAIGQDTTVGRPLQWEWSLHGVIGYVLLLAVLGGCSGYDPDREPTPRNLTLATMEKWSHALSDLGEKSLSECDSLECVRAGLIQSGRYEDVYLDKISVDGWGHPFRFSIIKPASLQVWCAGQDGIFEPDGADDIRLTLSVQGKDVHLSWVNGWDSRKKKDATLFDW